MSNLLDRFNVTVVGSDSKIGDYISTIAPSGDFKRIKDLEVILNSWNNILLTPTRSYIFDPEYGSDLYRLIFEPADEETAKQIKNEVIDKLERYDDRATVESVAVVFNSNRKGFNVAIKVDFQEIPAELSVEIDESIYFKFFEVPITD